MNTKPNNNQNNTKNAENSILNKDHATKKAKLISSLVLILGLIVFVVGVVMIVKWNIFVWGIIIGIVGSITASLFYTIYQTLIREKQNEAIENEMVAEQNN